VSEEGRAGASYGRPPGHRQGPPRPRASDIPGLYLGRLSPGPANAITDVPGVRVGHSTIVRGEGPLVPGRGPVRTGVTAVLPHEGNVFAEKVPAAVHVINGFGKAVGLAQVMECGVLETPVLLTNTLNVGRVADALIGHMVAENPEIGIDTGTVNPVVAECNDGWLNDIQGRHAGPEHVAEALADARAADRVAEGAVGAGTGMSAFGWKGGIGTASRLVPAGEGRRYVLGALVLSNFGAAPDLVVGGWPVGRYLTPPGEPDAGALQGEQGEPEGAPGHSERRGPAGTEGAGSVIVVLATDAPLDARQLRRVAVRAVVGLVRTGARLHHGSGDFVIAFSTAYRIPHTFEGRRRPEAGKEPAQPPAPVSAARLPDDHPLINELFVAAGEAVEEAVLNSLFQAHTVAGRDGHVRHALPVEEVARLVERWRRA